MMRVLLRLSDRRGLSNMVGYVLLISITIALSILVYNWLSFYIGDEDVGECPEGVGVSISSSRCYASHPVFGPGRLVVTLKNKGRFTIDGYRLRVHDQKRAEFGFYTFDEVGVSLAPGEEYEETYYFKNYTFDGYNVSKVTLVEVQPFVEDEGNVSCKSYAFQDVVCYSGSPF